MAAVLSLKAPRIAVIGTGPAGVAAVRGLAQSGVTLSVFDEQPRSGGNIHRVPMQGPATDFEQFCAQTPSIELVTGARVLSVDAQHDVWFDQGQGAEVQAFDAVILACGAFDTHDPVPGLPAAGVSSAGALQALLKGQASVPAGAIVIAGSGPFLSVVAAGLVRAGAHVTHVLDRLRRSDYARLAPWGVGVPGNTLEFLQTHHTLLKAGVRVRYGTGVAALDSGSLLTDQGESILFDRLGLTERFVPQTQLARTAGCAVHFDERGGYWVVSTDEQGRSSQPGVYVIGEGQGIRGWRHAALSGEHVVTAVETDLGLSPTTTARYSLKRRFLVGFAQALEAAQARRQRQQLDDQAIICACEQVSVRQVDAAVDLGLTDLSSIKVVTRCGMGPCQGRYCEAQVSARIRAQGHWPRSALNQRAFTRPLSVAEVMHESD